MTEPRVALRTSKLLSLTFRDLIALNVTLGLGTAVAAVQFKQKLFRKGVGQYNRCLSAPHICIWRNVKVTFATESQIMCFGDVKRHCKANAMRTVSSPVGVRGGRAAELPQEDLEVRRQRAVNDEVGGAAMEREMSHSSVSS